MATSLPLQRPARASGGKPRAATIGRGHDRTNAATDLAARYGGDEFAVLLIDADPAMARQIASRIEIALRAGQHDPQLSVSVGISIYPDDGRSAQDLLKAADRELYQRKRVSRGRTVALRAQ